MKILVDWDNTLVNFLELFGAKFAELFPDKPVPRYTQHKTYDLSKTYGISWELIEVIFNQIRRDSFYKAAAPMDATFFIWFKKLIEEGHEVEIATKNPEFMRDNFDYWLSKYGIYNVPINFVNNMEDKLYMDFDVLIDDHPSFAISDDWWKEHPNQHLFLYDAPFNYRHKLYEPNQHRVYNWREIYNGITEIVSSRNEE